MAVPALVALRRATHGTGTRLSSLSGWPFPVCRAFTRPYLGRGRRAPGDAGLNAAGSQVWVSVHGSLCEHQRRANDRAIQSATAPPVMLISLAVMVRAQSEAANVAVLATSS
jgi:hypothetical protein